MALFETGQWKGMSKAETTIDYSMKCICVLYVVVGGNDLKQRMSQSNESINQFEIIEMTNPTTLAKHCFTVPFNPLCPPARQRMATEKRKLRTTYA
jgi:hypothetical protein